MGGEGSGRKPDVTKAILNAAQQRREIGFTFTNPVELPDYSGVSSHAKTISAFDDLYVNVIGDTMTGALQFQDALGGGNAIIENPTPGGIPVQGTGASLSITAGSGSLPEAPGGIVYLMGGAYGVGSETFTNGLVVVGTTPTTYTLTCLQNGQTTAGVNTNDLIVGGRAYGAGTMNATAFQTGDTLAPSGYALFMGGTADTSVGMDRTNSGAGHNLTINAGWAANGSTDQAGGSLILQGGTSTGAGASTVVLKGAAPGASGTTDRTPTTLATFLADGTIGLSPRMVLPSSGGISLTAGNISTDTTTGTKIATGSTQKLGFFGATPIVRVPATTDLGTVLSNLGLRTAGTAYPITTSGGVTFTGGLTVSTTDMSITDVNVKLGTTTGTKFGTGTTQKLSFYNNTPIVQPANTTDLGVVLSDLGLRAAGTGYPITTSGAVALTGTFSTNTVTLNDANNIVVGSTTGTKIGTATTQKIGFYNKTPIVQQANTAGAVTAGASYTATEQAMLNDCYSVLRNMGILS